MCLLLMSTRPPKLDGTMLRHSKKTSLPVMPSTTEFTQAQKSDRRFFGMTVVQIVGILIAFSLVVCCVGSVAIYMLFGS